MDIGCFYDEERKLIREVFIGKTKQVLVKPACIVLLCFVPEGSCQMFHVFDIVHPGKLLGHGRWALLFSHIGDAGPGGIQYIF